jgi:hypothetical protein
MDIMERLIAMRYLVDECDPVVFWDMASTMLTQGAVPLCFVDLVELG